VRNDVLIGQRGMHRSIKLDWRSRIASRQPFDPGGIMPADLPKDLLEGLPIDLLDGLPADPPSDVPVDGRFHLYLDNDHMAASISIEPPLHGGAAVAEEQVRAEMTARGVVAGILDDALRQVIEQGIGSYVCIAKGLEPTPGRPAVFTNLIERPLDHHAQAS